MNEWMKWMNHEFSKKATWTSYKTLNTQHKLNLVMGHRVTRYLFINRFSMEFHTNSLLLSFNAEKFLVASVFFS